MIKEIRRLESTLKSDQNGEWESAENEGDMISPNEFDATLRRLLKKKAFVPFVVELDDRQRILIRNPVLA
jgi:hypothetical protein